MFGWKKKTAEDAWTNYEPQWLSSGWVLGGAVGPYFAVSKEHKLCERFAKSHPDSAEFLLKKLRDPNPILAAYAFKCLIRVIDVTASDIPADVADRADEITVQQTGCIAETKQLGQFISEYFEEPIDAEA